MKHREFPALGEVCCEEQLPNGLTLRVVPKRDFARKYAFLAVNVGAIDTAFSLDGRKFKVPAGIAHYLEHKMFDLPEGDAMNLFAEHGGSPNAFTGYAMTAYYFSCTEEFEENLKLLLRMVSTPYFLPESVEKERGIIAQEIRMYLDSADSRVGEELNAALYANHPIRVPIAGSVESIAAIDAELLAQCHAAFYRPENMALCVVGDVDAQAVAALAATAMPALPRVRLERDYGAAETMLPAIGRVERQMEVSMPTFALGFKCPPAPKGMERLRTEIVGELATGILAGESSPLYSSLYERGLIDADFYADYDSVEGASFLSVGGDSCDPDAVVRAVLDEAARIAAEGFDPALFERLKRSSLGRRMRGLDSFESICYRIGAYYFEGADYFRFPEAYASVEPEAVRSFLADCVQPERAAVCIIRPKEES